MKLASLKGGRDGRLVVVSGNLERCLPIDAYPTLQAALDEWSDARPALEAIAARLAAGEGEPFDQAACDSPYLAPTSGPTARRTSITSNSCARRASST